MTLPRSSMRLKLLIFVVVLATLVGLVLVVADVSSIPRLGSPYPGPSDSIMVPLVIEPYPGPRPTLMPTSTPSSPPTPNPCNVCYHCSSALCYNYCIADCGCEFRGGDWPDTEWWCPFFPPEG